MKNIINTIIIIWAIIDQKIESSQNEHHHRINIDHNEIAISIHDDQTYIKKQIIKHIQTIINKKNNLLEQELKQNHQIAIRSWKELHDESQQLLIIQPHKDEYGIIKGYINPQQHLHILNDQQHEEFSNALLLIKQKLSNKLSL